MTKQIFNSILLVIFSIPLYFYSEIGFIFPHFAIAKTSTLYRHWHDLLYPLLWLFRFTISHSIITETLRMGVKWIESCIKTNITAHTYIVHKCIELNCLLWTNYIKHSKWKCAYVEWFPYERVSWVPKYLVNDKNSNNPTANTPET